MMVSGLRYVTALAVGLLLMAISCPVLARVRLAVAVTVDDAPELSDSLTEVALARLAELGAWELVGLAELQSHLSKRRPIPNGGIGLCLGKTDCRRWLASLVRVETMVVGHVAQNRQAYQLELAIVDAGTNQTVAVAERIDCASQATLILAIQRGMTQLFAPLPQTAPASPSVKEQRPESPAPLRSRLTVFPLVPMKVTDAHTEQKKLRYVTYGTAALSLAAFSVAAVTGIAASRDPEATTRRDTQAALERRADYARLTNGLLVAGGLFAVASIVTVAWSW